MTSPGAGPTREEIAEILWEYPLRGGPYGVLWKDFQGSARQYWLGMADALLARLRPALEHEHWKRVQNEQAYDREVELHEETRKQLDAIRADLARMKDDATTREEYIATLERGIEASKLHDDLRDARARDEIDKIRGSLLRSNEEGDALRGELGRQDADLAACVEALTRAVYEGRAITLAAEEPTKDWWAIHRLVYDQMRAALARRGVQATKP